MIIKTSRDTGKLIATVTLKNNSLRAKNSQHRDDAIVRQKKPNGIAAHSRTKKAGKRERQEDFALERGKIEPPICLRRWGGRAPTASRWYGYAAPTCGGPSAKQ